MPPKTLMTNEDKQALESEEPISQNASPWM